MHYDKVKAALTAMRADCGSRHVPKLLAVAEAEIALREARVADADAFQRWFDNEIKRPERDSYSRRVAECLVALDAALAALGEP